MTHQTSAPGRILVTGAAGFIGATLARELLARGEKVVGVDCLTPYYDVAFKRRRLAEMTGGADERFSFHEIDVADEAALGRLLDENPDIDRIVHLAAQAGVRWSIEAPYDYCRSNLLGQLVILEVARRLGPRLRHLVYASSSSVYGSRSDGPFREADKVDQPASLYAATKIGGEAMTQAYSSLYQIPATGLRFFTVYGPWGRPDMAYWQFTESILQDRPIALFNDGALRRDFTYIDDIVGGVIAVLDGPPARGAHRIYNIGNSRPETLTRFVELIERFSGRSANRVLKPMQPGDVLETSADVSAMKRDFGWEPSTTLEEGLKRFVSWWRAEFSDGRSASVSSQGAYRG